MIPKALMAASTKPIILTILKSGEDYGYNIIQRVKELSGGTLDWSDGMLYPVLQRLEKENLISSQWIVSDEGRHRKYYKITQAGPRGAHGGNGPVAKHDQGPEPDLEAHARNGVKPCSI